MENKIIEINWSEWHDFPSAGKIEFDATPFAGVYKIRLKGTEIIVNVGYSKELKSRMKTLLPPPTYKSNRRHNMKLRNYILENIDQLEYCTANAKSSEEAIAMKAQILHTCSPMY